MSYPTLLDIAKQNGIDSVVGLIDETIKTHPELLLGAARTISGMNYKTIVRTALGNTGGSFRNANEGSAAHKHTYENRLVETYILEPRWKCDKAVADKHEDGAQSFIALEAAGTMEGEMQGLSSQFYYGNEATFGNTKGFPGLLQSYDATNMVVDAGGTTAATASSVWLVRFGPRHVQWIWGANGQLLPSDIRIESINDPNDSTKQFDGYVQTFQAYPGLQVGSLLSVVRIKKITADSTHTLTDAMIYSALGLFPSGTVPDLILMNRRSQGQLRSSRTATNATGIPAPLPTEVEGIPIKITDAISNVETLTL